MRIKYNAKGRYKDYDTIIEQLTSDLGSLYEEEPDPPSVPGGSHANRTLEHEVAWLRNEVKGCKDRQKSLIKKVIGLLEFLKTKDAA